MSEQPRKPDAADVPVDPELARLYRDAAREEPPQHLDAAILAAARREARAQPRPLEQPAGGTVSLPMKAGNVPPAANRYRRWHVSVALAAVLVLSVSVVILHREGEERQPVEAPGAPPAALERRDAPAPPAQPPASPSAQKAIPERRLEDPRAVPLPERSVRGAQPSQREEAAPAAAAEAESPGDQTPSTLAAPQAARPRMAEEQAGTPFLSADAPPERWGERIVALRQQGKAAEADALLAEFRRRFPDRAVPHEWTR